MLWRIILFVCAVYLGFKVYRLIAGHVAVPPARSVAQARSDGSTVNEMVRDPVCGVYVAANTALSLRSKGKTYFFCSEDCARRFATENK